MKDKTEDQKAKSTIYVGVPYLRRRDCNYNISELRRRKTIDEAIQDAYYLVWGDDDPFNKIYVIQLAKIKPKKLIRAKFSLKEKGQVERLAPEGDKYEAFDFATGEPINGKKDFGAIMHYFFNALPFEYDYGKRFYQILCSSDYDSRFYHPELSNLDRLMFAIDEQITEDDARVTRMIGAIVVDVPYSDLKRDKK